MFALLFCSNNELFAFALTLLSLLNGALFDADIVLPVEFVVVIAEMVAVVELVLVVDLVITLVGILGKLNASKFGLRVGIDNSFDSIGFRIAFGPCCPPKPLALRSVLCSTDEVLLLELLPVLLDINCD